MVNEEKLKEFECMGNCYLCQLSHVCPDDVKPLTYKKRLLKKVPITKIEVDPELAVAPV